MPQFKITILAFRKGSMLDPEAGPILGCLKRLGHTMCEGLRKAKLITFIIESRNKEEAEAIGTKVCANQEIINPVSESPRVIVEAAETSGTNTG